MLIKADTVVDCQWGYRVRKGPIMCCCNIWILMDCLNEKEKKKEAEIVLCFWPALRRNCSSDWEKICLSLEEFDITEKD